MLALIVESENALRTEEPESGTYTRVSASEDGLELGLVHGPGSCWRAGYREHVIDETEESRL